MAQPKHGRRYYLSDIPVDEATRRFHAALEEVGALRPTPAETVPLRDGRGRITAEPVWAKVSSPNYDAAAMDGVAVRSKDTAGANETSPVRLKVGEQAVWIDTGAAMPPDFDAVIMIEVVHQVDGSTVEVQAPAAPYQHVRPLGEDIVATELVLAQGHRLRPQDLAACAAAGLSEVSVRRPPAVVVIPTGTELVPVGSSLKPGDIVESNSIMLAAMVEEWGGAADRWEPVPDEYDTLRASLLEAVESADVVLVNAGSSAGSEDYTARLVEDLGSLLIHGVALRPGHPVVIGLVQGKPVLGIPGYPVSASLACELFVRPLVERSLGTSPQPRSKISAAITRKVVSPIGEDEYVRVRLGRVGDKMVAAPIQRGAGVIMSMVRADGLLVLPRFSEGVDAGDEVTVELLRSEAEIEGTIVAIGSHDMTLDLLASELRRRHPTTSLASSNVGSLGGLLALSRGEAHLAGTHLLDEDSGDYNIPHIKQYASGIPIVLVNLVRRVQGLIVPPGNPRSLSSLRDLARADVTFVNRQRGSGTRVLLDYTLRQAGMTAQEVRGYEREEYTHLGVAAAVAGGMADVGLGVLSAAKAMGLDFVPLETERYDLAIPRRYYDGEVLEPLLSLIRDRGFRRQVEDLGGYETSTMGDVVAEIGSDAP